MMQHRYRRDILRLTVMVVAVAWVGCETAPPKTKVVVPSAATQAPEYEGDGSIPEQRYVIRMSDGERDWEVQFPDVATGYEMHIPLDERRAKGPMDSVHWEGENMTEADKELLQELRRKRGDMEREGIFVDGEHVNEPNKSGQQGNQGQQGQQGNQGQQGESGNEGELPSSDELSESGLPSKKKKGSGSEAAPYRPSYLLGIENVRKLYKAGKYELAMVRLKKLEEAYPGDEKILSMKGTLWVKLGRESLARKAWERVLQINPDNQEVIEALKRLNDSE